MRWSMEAEKVMDFSKFFAKRSQHSYVNSGHILAALHGIGEGITHSVLKDEGLTAQIVLDIIDQEELEKDIRITQKTNLPFSPEAILITQVAINIAQNFEESHVVPKDLLIAVFGYEYGVKRERVIDRIIQKSGVDIKKIHQKIVQP